MKTQNLTPDLLYSYGQLVAEICDLTGLDQATVQDRVWKEALQRGRNVYDDAVRFGLDFHVFNEKMARFYRETDGFIFETTVESCRPEKQELLERVQERLQNCLVQHGEISTPLNLLMFGDGAGDNTLYLSDAFKDRMNFYYSDVPGSKTYDFAVKRFQKHGRPVHLITEEAKIPRNFFDCVISLEVLEHLPDPLKTIRDLASYLKTGGRALISEYFDGVFPLFPTHLRSNLKYAGKTPFLFLRENLILTYYPKQSLYSFKPMEFTRVAKTSIQDRIKLFSEAPILLTYWRHVATHLLHKLIP